MVFSVLIALFAVQNAEVVTISLLWYKLNLSQAVVILCSALFGVLIMLPFDIFRTVKHKLKLMEMSAEIKKLREEIARLENKPAAESPVVAEIPMEEKQELK